MTGPRAIWLVLAILAAAWTLLSGVPFWITTGTLICAVLPPLVGMFMRGSATDARVAELESAFWIAVATAGVATTGGAVSPLTVLFAIPIGLAWTFGRPRLVWETAGFSIMGYVLGAYAGAGEPWLNHNAAEMIGIAYGACGLALVGAIAVLAADPHRRAPQVAPVRGVTTDPQTLLKLRRAEMRAQASEAKLAQAQRAVEAAEASLEARTRFFAQTSHELRTPLNAIIGFADLMRSAVFGPLPERYQEYAELIREGGYSLSIVVDDVLDLSRIEAGKYDILPEPVSLTELAEDAVRFMADMAQRKGVGLVVESDDDVEAFADQRAVRQIALNLISNGLKFTPVGGRVTVSTLAAAGGALLAVSDTGVGISEEELTRLSRAFEQGEAGRAQKGAGLGLSVVRAFAELHGGRLDIESREGGGSTIAVFFPDEKPA
jgi:signal transduction histidine kinase